MCIIYMHIIWLSANKVEYSNIYSYSYVASGKSPVLHTHTHRPLCPCINVCEQKHVTGLTGLVYHTFDSLLSQRQPAKGRLQRQS